MSPRELLDQLRSSLGATYSITRELGGGGMSRVFEAEDTALGRTVVIKVLHPELAAGVNADRFKREVQLSARLQHPHIVPVLTAGEVDGLPYYVMPFVRGDSVRAALARGPFSIDETVSVLSDVAKALAFAHAEGVVHRDIKPDNILLSAGAATVADFGIAKALSSARQGQSGETLTSLGTSLGTPAYMAPEQVAGDPNVDQRADIYSLGCVAYEMLTGQPPFAGKSPQQLLAAHVMEAPVPVGTRRAGIPSSLAALVMRCLEKEPALRPQTASEIVTQLTSSGVQHESLTATSTRRRAPTWTIAAGAVLVLAAAGFVAYRSLGTRGGPADSSLNLAVAPFEVLDPQLGLWKEGMVDVLSRNLDGAGPIRSVSPSVAIKKWEGRSDRTSALAFGKRIGAKIVLYGQLMPAGRDLVDAKVWVVDTDHSDQTPAEVQVRDSSSRMDRITDSLSVRVLSAIGRTRTLGATRIATLGSGSLPAIKSFLQGAQYFRRTQWDSAAGSFRQAVAADTSFGIAYAMLAQSIGWSAGAGDRESQEMYRRAGASLRPGLSARDSLILTSFRHYAAYNRERVDRATQARLAIAAAEEATRRYPNDPEVWYLLGDMRFHADPNVTERQVLAHFDRAIQADSDFAPAYVHATEISYRDGAEAGGRYASAYLARNPRDVEADGIRLARLLADPAQLRTSAARTMLDTVGVNVSRKAYPVLARLPDSAEAAIHLLRAGVRRAPEGPQKRTATQALIGQLAMRGHISEAWALSVDMQNYHSAVIAGLGLVPADSAVRVMQPWLTQRNDAGILPYPALAAAHDTLALQKAAKSIEGFARIDTVATRAPILRYVIASLRAYEALARGDTVTATRLFDALPDSIVDLPFDQFMRARLIAKQDPKRALALLERRGTPGTLLFAARELERGRIAERLGDRERAVDAFAYVAAVWANSDSPQLRDATKEARDALGRLDADGRLRKDLGGRKG